MARTKGAKCRVAPEKSYPNDLGCYIRKIKIPILEDIFCCDEEGNPVSELKARMKDTFTSLFAECKSTTEADRITNQYIDNNIDRFIEGVYVIPEPAIVKASHGVEKKQEKIEIEDTSMEINWSSCKQMTIFDFLK